MTLKRVDVPQQFMIVTTVTIVGGRLLSQPAGQAASQPGR
jgi:hypothetical protein